MKKGHLIALGIIAVAIAIILTSIGDASSYESFDTALEMKKDGEDKAIHVVGKLQKDAAGQVEGIEVREDKTSFTFMWWTTKAPLKKYFTISPCRLISIDPSK